MALFDAASTRASFAEMYERLLVEPLFRPWVPDLFNRVALSPGDSVLDVACGTGIVARTARAQLGREARVVGIDQSPPMLAVAAAVAPDVEWREGSASALPVATGETFDVVICQQGLQFFPDKPAAAREMHRVLPADGRVAVATWRPLPEIPFLHALHAIAEHHLGPVVDQRHSFGETAPLALLLADAGFHDVAVETISRTIHFADGAAFVRMNTMALVGMSMAAPGLADEKRAELVAAIVNDSASVVSQYANGDGMAFDISTNTATARK